MPHFQYLSACVRRSIHVKRLTAKHPLGLRQWKSAITIYTYIKESFVYTSGRCSVYHYRPKPCIRVKAHSIPLPCYGIRPNPCLCTQCVVCVNIDTCNVQLKHAQFVLAIRVYMYCGCTNTYVWYALLHLFRGSKWCQWEGLFWQLLYMAAPMWVLYLAGL